MKVLFVAQGWLTFVRKDFEILKEVYEVKEFIFSSPLNIFQLWEEIKWCDLTFSWFGKLPAFFAVLFSKILGKKAVVVAGGDDVVYLPEINYGMFSCWWKKWCPLFVFRYADLILSVSKFNLNETIYNARANPAKVKLVYHGFDAQKFRPTDGIKREELVITVGGVDWERLERKGYERFIKSAIYLPEAQFVLVGQWHDNSIDYLRKVAPNNVTLVGRIDDEELIHWLSRAKVYAQASIHEAFGCSVAEAMLCECVPVVFRRAALPEVVGDCGFYIDELTPEALSQKIRDALQSSEDLGKRARERIKTLFPIEKRKRELLQAIESL